MNILLSQYPHRKKHKLWTNILTIAVPRGNHIIKNDIEPDKYLHIIHSREFIEEELSSFARYIKPIIYEKDQLVHICSNVYYLKKLNDDPLKLMIFK